MYTAATLKRALRIASDRRAAVHRLGAGTGHCAVQGRHRRLVSGLNARPKELLDEWLHRIKEELAAHDRKHPEAPSAPFAVNQIVHKSNDRLDHDVEVCLKHKVPLAITSLGAREDVYKAFKDAGTLVLHDVINVKFAQQGHREGRRRARRCLRGRRWACGAAVAVRPGARTARVLRRSDRSLGRHLARRLDPGGRSARRRFRLCWLDVHRLQGSQRHRQLQGGHRRQLVPMASSTPTCSRACTATT